MSETPTLAERHAARTMPPRPPYLGDGTKAADDAYNKASAKWDRARDELIEACLFLGEQVHRRIQDRAAAGDGTMTITMREWDALRSYREDHGFDDAWLDEGSHVLLMGVVVTVKHEEFQHGESS